MICPHCHNNIPNGSNICPLCFSNLAGLSTDEDGSAQIPEPRQGTTKRKTSSGYSGTRTKVRKSRKKQGRAPLVIAIVLILVLIVIIGLIIWSMFSGSSLLPFGRRDTAETTPEPAVSAEATSTFLIFGAETPVAPVLYTDVPSVEITPTPEPTEEPQAVTYTTLKKGDTGDQVVLLQQALAQLGLLNSAADGIYGTGTMTAVRNFQQQNGLDVDGIAGSKTQELLFSMSPVEPKVDATVAPGEILDLPG